MKRQLWDALPWKRGTWLFRMMEELRKRSEKPFLTSPGERRAVDASGMGME